MSHDSASIETQATNITDLAEEALNTEDLEATKAFLEEVNKTPDKEAVANHIAANQSGFPTMRWSSSDSGWQSMTFNIGRKEINWNSYVDDPSELTDEQLARYEKDPESDADNVVHLAKRAIQSDDAQDIRNFIQAINSSQTSPYDLASLIQAEQSGPIDAIGHAFSGNPSISWKWDSNPMGRWATEIKFKQGETEVSWNPYLREVSEMSDRDVSSYKIDYAELRRQGEENARQYKMYLQEAVVEVEDMSSLAETVLENPNAVEAREALLEALKNTSPLKTSQAIKTFQESGKSRSAPEIDFAWGAHPMGDWIKHITFKGHGREITWKPGDEDIEIKEGVDI